MSKKTQTARISYALHSKVADLSFSKIKDILEAASYVVVLFGIPGYFVQQSQQAQSKRIDSTLQYISLYQTDRISNAREELISSWFQYANKVKLMNEQGVSNAVLRHMVASMIEASVERDPVDNLQRSLLTINDFYNQLQTCVSSNACDQTTAGTYFSAEAKQMNRLYGEWFVKARGDLSIVDLGIGLEKIAAITP